MLFNIPKVSFTELTVHLTHIDTIITAFPKRWGRNKPDDSGVHKSIRVRLETAQDSIKSIYHLGKNNVLSASVV